VADHDKNIASVVIEAVKDAHRDNFGEGCQQNAPTLKF
jgi:hypothetical protein